MLIIAFINHPIIILRGDTMLILILIILLSIVTLISKMQTWGMNPPKKLSEKIECCIIGFLLSMAGGFALVLAVHLGIYGPYYGVNIFEPIGFVTLFSPVYVSMVAVIVIMLNKYYNNYHKNSKSSHKCTKNS